MKQLLFGIGKILLTIFLVATVTFLLLHLVPGSPFTGNKALTPEVLKNLETKYHLNEPIWVQYFLYIKGLLRGDLGPSLKYVNRSVSEILFSALPVSLVLGFLALIVAVPLGILCGIASGVFVRKPIGYLLLFLITLGISLPNFLIAAGLVDLFALKMGLLPVALFESPFHLILPVITLSLVPLAYIARIVRAQMIEILSEDFIKTSISYGVPLSKIIFKYAFKNCLISVITILGPITAVLITGSFVVEYIFAIPGIGRYFITAFTNRDYFLITGTAILFSFILSTLNVVIDSLYRKIDPRIT